MNNKNYLVLNALNIYSKQNIGNNNNNNLNEDNERTKIVASTRNSKWKSTFHKKIGPTWIEFWLAKIEQTKSQHVTQKQWVQDMPEHKKIRLYHEISESLIIQREASHYIQKYLTEELIFWGRKARFTFWSWKLAKRNRNVPEAVLLKCKTAWPCLAELGTN